MSKKALPAHEIGSGNIFADLGLPNAEEHQLKAALVIQLGRIIKERFFPLGQVVAASKFFLFSLFPNKLPNEVEINQVLRLGSARYC